MAHRGRINVLVNVLGKAPQELFSEFEGVYDPARVKGSGDVKYHMGFSADLRTPGGNVHVVLAFNPSHLEIVDPVVEGSVRARQERRGDEDGAEILPVLIHGDAAFAGQGVVAETFQLSQARGFRTGGTVHIVINNQVGFTISDPRDARSTPYCSDIARMIEAPVFHVNGDDPEAVVFVTRLALEYRQTFHKDVVIDLVCYRRHGHNEADEPAATQPGMYQVIRKHPTTRQLYARAADGAGRRGRAGGRAPERGLPPARRGGPAPAADRARDDRQRIHGGLDPVREGRLGRAAQHGAGGRRNRRAGPRDQPRAPELQPASPGGQDRRRPGADGRRRDPHGLGLCRADGLRQPHPAGLHASGSPARTAVAARSSIATACSTTS